MLQEAFKLSSPADGLPLGGIWILSDPERRHTVLPRHV